MHGKTNNPENYGAFRRDINPTLLRELYEKHTDREIGKIYGVSDVIVSRYREEYGISTVTPRERDDKGRRSQGLRVIADLTPIELTSLYARMGDATIGKMFGVSKPVILRLREQWGVGTLTKTDRATETCALSTEQQDIIVGSLLGDGHITRRGTFRVTHTHMQMGYLLHLHQRLAPLSQPIWFDEKEQDNGVIAYTFGFATMQHSWLQQLRKVFYPESMGRKVFPTEMLQNLSPRSLAYWYWDDGHLDETLPSFALGDITQEEAEAVAEHLHIRFALDAYVKPSSRGTSCLIVGIRARTTDVFFALVSPYLLPDMHHKVPAECRPALQKPFRPRNTVGDVALPKDLLLRAKGWTSLDAAGKGELVRCLSSFWSEKGFPYPTPRAEEIDILARLTFEQVVVGDRLKRVGVGQSTCQSMVPHIWDTRSHESDQSPIDIFKDAAQLRHVIRVVFEMGGIPNAPQIRSGVRLLRYTGAYNFRPAAAKVLVDRFCPPGGLVFDPCAGWGGRMLGTLLSHARPRYMACEPQPETREGLGRLQAWVEDYVPDMRGKVDVSSSPAEDFDFPTGVDVVLTSPPYWKKIVYGAQPNLAGNRYLTYDSWLSGFWEVVIRKAAVALRPGGWLILNVDDVEVEGVQYPLVEDTKRLVAALGFGPPSLVLRYDMGKPGNRENYEPVMCWAKGVGVQRAEAGLSMETQKCESCGRVVPLRTSRCGACRTEDAKHDRVCAECGETFKAVRSDALFCTEACYARYKRRKSRELHPAKTTRVFTCTDCGKPWETALLGQFKRCPLCVEKAEVSGRTKACAYRTCGQSFTDTSTQNSMSYCCEDHRRREKMYRSGKAKDESFFRAPDAEKKRTCIKCRESFILSDGEKNNRCLICRSAARDKVCRGCGKAYRDESENNTRRYCGGCPAVSEESEDCGVLALFSSS